MENIARMTAADADDDFEAWVAPHLARMALVAARLGPSADHDDIVQEALLRAWRHRASFDPQKGSLGGWLFAITANVARTHARGSWLKQLRHLWPVRSVDLNEKIDLEAAIARLPTRQRLAVEFFYAIGLSIAEAAQVLGCSEGTVKSTLADARTALRANLSQGEEPASNGRS